MAAAGQGHAHRVEQGAFDEYAGGCLGAAGGLAADHARQGLHPGAVGDDAIRRVRGVVLAVQRPEGLARAGAEAQDAALHLVGVEDVQGTAEVEGEEVGDVHQGADRAQADGEEAALQPLRAGAVADAADGAAQHPGAGLGHVYGPGDGAGAIAGHRRRRPGPQGAQAGCRQVPRYAAHGQRVAAVRCHADLDDGIVQAGPFGIRGADGRIVRQVHDPGMVLAQPHLPQAEQHAGALDAADFADLEGDAAARDEAARGCEHREHPGPRVRRPAHDGHHAVAGVHLAGAQAVGVGVLHRLDHAGDAERGQRGAGVLDALQLKADGGQAVGDGVQAGAGVQVGAQPA